jgi:hypothetical protein
MKTITQTSHCLAPARAGAPINGPAPSATYARMFPELPSFEADEAFLHALGRGGGLCDGGDIDDSAEALGEVAAGWPIFGQFVAHDITADRSALRVHTDTAVLRNARSPQLNLECLYGDGPVGHPFLYQRNDPAKFLLGARGADVQRNQEGIAVIGDPRNDSHALVSQMHLAMLKLHNSFVDQARRGQVANDRVFEEAVRQFGGIISGASCINSCRHSWVRSLPTKCLMKARGGSAPLKALSYHLSLPMQLIDTATVRYATGIC